MKYTSKKAANKKRGAIAHGFLFIAAFLAFAPSSSAQNASGLFLAIPTNARATALGQGFFAIGSGIDSVSLNPAGLAQLRSAKELSLQYVPYIQNMNLGSLAYGFPSRFGSFGLSYVTLRSGSLDGRDDNGNPTGNFNAVDHSLGLSFARPLAKVDLLGGFQPRVGATLKYVTSRIASYQASTYAMDLGAQGSFNIYSRWMALGLSVRNMGPGLRYVDQSNSLPLSLGIGAGAQIMGPLWVVAGLDRQVADARTDFSIGTEFMVVRGLYLRGNYGITQAQQGLARNFASLAGGLGLRLSRTQIDYAFIPMGELGSTQRISLTFRFGARAPASAQTLRPLQSKEFRENNPDSDVDQPIFLETR